MGRLPRRPGLRSHELRHAAEVHRVGRPDAADGPGSGSAHAGRCRLPGPAFRPRARLGDHRRQRRCGRLRHAVRPAFRTAPLQRHAAERGGCAPARMDRRFLRRHLAQRGRWAHCQPAEFRRHEPHHRRGLRLVAGCGVPGRHRAVRRARSATCASARRRRCRHAVAVPPSTPAATASSSAKALRWWR